MDGVEVRDPQAIPRWRYLAGMLVILSAHAFVSLLLWVGAPFSARYRKVRPGWRAYSRDVLRGCLDREGFRVGAAPTPGRDRR